MLGTKDIVAFVPSRNPAKARAFYEGILGLRFVSEDPFALVLDANGVMIRVANVSSVDGSSRLHSRYWGGSSKTSPPW